MPHVPDFPTPSDDAEDEGRQPERRSIIDRIIGDGDLPTGAAPLPGLEPEPTPSR